MKGKKLGVILAALAAVIVLVVVAVFALGGNNDKDKDKEPNKNTEQNSEKDTEKIETVTLTDEALGGDLLIDFTKGADASVVFESDGWSNGDVFNVVWTKDNVKYADGKMSLGITKEDKKVWLNDQEVTLPYTAGEARTQNYFGYGDYEVKMKPSGNMGTASTFFVCTGNYDSKYVLDENGNVVYNEDGSIKSVPNPHDEIDIEFLGKDTTKVQFNFFVNGKGGNEYMYDLGFDAAEEFHEYGFRWTEDSITWFIDDKPVYKVTTDTTVEPAENVRVVDVIPSTPGRLLMNYWCGNEDAHGWMGVYEGNVKDNGCEYQWIQTTTKGAPLNPEVTLPGGVTIEVPEVDWSKIGTTKPAFSSTEKYTVTTDGNSSNIKYSSVGGSDYINVEMDITDAAKAKNVLHLTLKNNGTKDVQVRVNVVDAELLARGAKNSSTNKAATMDGAEARTDLEWGGSFFDIAPGKTVEAVISFTGNVEKLQLMIDSSRNDTATYSGDVTVSDIKFAKVGELVGDTALENLPEAENSLIINDKEYFFEGNEYTVKSSDNKTKLNVTYSNIEGATYKNIAAGLSGLSKDYNKLTMKVKNNGTKAVKVRIDVNSQTQVSANTKACNIYAVQDGTEVYTDKDWGGSQFEIAAGKTSTLEVYFDPAAKVDALIIFIDSWNYLDEGKGMMYSGNITLSDVAFSKATVPSKPEEPSEPEPPVVPEPPVGETTRVDADLTFNSDTYIVTKDDTNKTWHVTYSNVGGADYAVISAAIESIDAGLNRYTVKVKNNGTITAKVRIDVLGATATNANTYACNISATQDGNAVNTDLEWGGSTFEIPAGETSVLEVVFNASKQAVTVNMFFDSHTYGDTGVYSGDLTLSDMAFIGVLQGEDDGPIVSPGAGNEGGEGDEGGEGQEPEQPGEGEDPAPEQPTHPESGDLTTTINGTEVTFDGNVTDAYGVNADDTKNELNVTYNRVIGDSYKNIWANVSAMAAENDIFAVEITNNGDTKVKVRIDITKDNAGGAMCNDSATANGNPATTDHEYGGGSQFEIPANSSVVIEVKYFNTQNPYAVKFFIDSYTYQDGNTYAGNVTFANMQFKSSDTQDEEDDDDQGGTENPPIQEPEVTYDELKYEWHPDGTGLTTSVSTWGQAFESVTVGYVGDGPDWGSNIVYRPVADVTGKHTFSLDIENTSDEAVKVRIGLQDNADQLINVSQSAEGGTAATEDGYSVVTINPGETARLTIEASADIAKIIVFPGNAGKPAVDWDGPVDAEVVLSNFKFEAAE